MRGYEGGSGGIKCTATPSDVTMSMSISIVLEFELNNYVEAGFISGDGKGGQEVLLPALEIDLPPGWIYSCLSPQNFGTS